VAHFNWKHSVESESSALRISLPFGHIGLEKTQTLTTWTSQSPSVWLSVCIKGAHHLLEMNSYTVNILGIKFMSDAVHSDADIYNLYEMFCDQSSMSCVQDCTGINMKSNITK